MKGFDMGGKLGLGGDPTSSQGLDMGEEVDSLAGNIELEVELRHVLEGPLVLEFTLRSRDSLWKLDKAKKQVLRASGRNTGILTLAFGKLVLDL